MIDQPDPVELTYWVEYWLYLRWKIIQVDEKIDASVVEGIHAALVVSRRIDMINSDHVGAQILHLLCIAFALVGVDQRVGRDELVCNA